jgi:hypothetical protein
LSFLFLIIMSGLLLLLLLLLLTIVVFLSDPFLNSFVPIQWNSAIHRLILHHITERRGRVVSTPASYSGGPGLKSRPGDRLSWQEAFRDFSQSLQANTEIMTQNYATTASFQILFSSSFTYHAFIRR